MRTIFILLIVFLPVFGLSQGNIVEDRPNRGQLKRMVYEQWDDWQPDPTTNILGLPKNIEGFIYWRILHNRYYNGEDKRPWRIDGPFQQNYASLFFQEKQDKNIEENSKAIMETDMETFINMSGNELDVAYLLFFEKKFNEIFGLIADEIAYIAYEYPKAFNAIADKPKFQDYMEYLDMTKDRIEIVHSSFVDKGKRIESYLEILKDLENRKKLMSAYLGQYSLMSKFPAMEELNTVREVLIKDYTPNDKLIVQKILETFTF